MEWATDYKDAGVGLRFDRAYAFRNDMPTEGSLGTGWRGPQDRQLITDGSGNATVYLEGGQSYSFQTTSGIYTPTGTRADTLVINTAGQTIWTSPAGEQTAFIQSPSTGLWSLQKIINEDGGTLTFIYATVGGVTQLSSIGDGQTRSISVTWTNGLISRLTFPSGMTIDYGYTAVISAAGMSRHVLTTATRSLAGQTRTVTYLYEDTAMPNALTGITDERGQRFATWAWDDTAARATSSKVGSAAELTSIAYNDTAMTRTATNALGRSEVYQYALVGGAWALTSVTGNATTHCPASARSLAYTSGYVSGQTDELGTQTTYARDGNGRETSRTEASGSSVGRTIGTTWSTYAVVPTKVTTTLSTVTDLYPAAPPPPGNGLSTSPHRYWRVRFDGNVAANNNVAVGEMEAFTKMGDPNLLATGVLDSSSTADGQSVKLAIDGQYGIEQSADGQWHNYSPLGQSGALYVDFGSQPRVLNHVVVTGVEAAYAPADPAGFDVQYSETGGAPDAAWSTAWTVSGQSAWSAFQRRRFDRPSYTDPAYTGSPYGAHRYWRVLMLDCLTPNYAFALSELEFRATPGGTDQTGAGTPIESSHYDSTLVPANAFDKNVSTNWASGSFGRQSPVKFNNFLGYDFGAGNVVKVAQVLIRSRADSSAAAEQSPSLWMLQFSDDNVVWNTASQFSDTTAWGVGEARLYTDPLYVTP